MENISENVKEYERLSIPDLEAQPSGVQFNPNIFGNIPVEVTVLLGKSKVPLDKVLSLSKGDLIELNKHAGEEVDLLVNGQLIAKGEVVAIGNNYGVKVTKVLT
jgi:flagellar motor switch protein FliN